MTGKPVNNSARRRQFALVFLVLLVTAAGNTAMQSVLPVIGREIRIPDMAVAVIFSLSALLWTFSAPYWARQSDLRGRRRLMQIGLLGFALSMLLCGLVVIAGIRGLIAPLVTFALFTMARGMFGLLGSAGAPAAQAYVAGRTTPAERTNALATLSSAFGLGTILGPAFSPFFILPVVGLAGPMLVFAVIGVATLIAVERGLPDDDPQHEGTVGRGAAASMPNVGGSATGASVTAAEEMMTGGRRERISFKDIRIRPFMIYGFAAGSLQAAMGQALGFFILDRMPGTGLSAPQMIGIALMGGAGATLLVQWGVIRMLHLNPSQLMRWGTVIAGIGAAGIALAPDFHALVLAFAISSAGFGFCRPGFTAGASLAVSRAEQGGLAGAVTAVNGSCFVLAPAIGIGLFELQAVLPYWIGALGLLALTIYAWCNPLLRSSSSVPL